LLNEQAPPTLPAARLVGLVELFRKQAKSSRESKDNERKQNMDVDGCFGLLRRMFERPLLFGCFHATVFNQATAIIVIKDSQWAGDIFIGQKHRFTAKAIVAVVLFSDNDSVELYMDILASLCQGMCILHHRFDPRLFFSLLLYPNTLAFAISWSYIGISDSYAATAGADFRHIAFMTLDLEILVFDIK
jgi:hypothetical protein